MIEIALFGGTSVTVDGAPLTGDAAQRRRLAILTLLVTPGFRPVSRDRLIGLLWPDAEIESARHLLSAAIHVLRKALGADAILVAGDDLALNPACVRADVTDFRAALERHDDEGAIALWKGEFLAGFYVNGAGEFEKWVDGERAELGRLYADALERAARARAAAGDAAGAANAWRLRAALDPYDARVAIALMEALSAAGQRATAIRHARLHAQLLEQEFGAAPDPEVVALAERLKQQPTTPVGEAAAPIGEPAAAVDGPAAPTDRSAAAAGVDGQAAAGAAPRPAPPVTGAVTAAPVSADASPRIALLVRRAMLPAALLAVVVTGVVLLLNATRRDFTVAVHPFSSADPDSMYFGQGLAEDLIIELDRIRGVHVISREVSFRTDTLAPPDAMRQLGRHVDAILLGRMHTRGSSRMVHVELVTRDGVNLYNEEHLAYDVGEFKHAVVDGIARQLGRRVERESAQRLAGDQVDPRARDLLYRGRSAWLSRTPDSLRAALRYFEQARAIDGRYAAAHVGVADALNMLGSYDYSEVAPDSAYPAAERAVRIALDLDPDHAGAHAALANVLHNYYRDLSGAERSYQRAIRAGPEQTSARQWYALVLAAQQRFREANDQARTATEQEPRVPAVLINRAHVLYYQRDFGAAREFAAAALQIDPRYSRAHLMQVLIDLATGERARALATLTQLLALSPTPEPVLVALHGTALAANGQAVQAQAQLARLEQARLQRHVPPELIALVHVALGQNDQAFRELEQALRTRSGGVVYLRVEPLMDPLRDDPRFDELVRRAGI